MSRSATSASALLLLLATPEVACFHASVVAPRSPLVSAAVSTHQPRMAAYHFVPALAPLFQPAGGPTLLTATSIARAGPVTAVLVAILSAPIIRIGVAIGVWMVALKRKILKQKCDEHDTCSVIYNRIESVLPLNLLPVGNKVREQEA